MKLKKQKSQLNTCAGNTQRKDEGKMMSIKQSKTDEDILEKDD